MNTPIHIILKTTEKELEMLKDSLFLDWCDEHATSIAHLQQLLINNRIYNWFCREYTKNEREFLLALQDVVKKNKQLHFMEARKLYDNYTTRIAFYPKALLTTIKIPKHNNINLGN